MLVQKYVVLRRSNLNNIINHISTTVLKFRGINRGGMNPAYLFVCLFYLKNFVCFQWTSPCQTTMLSLHSYHCQCQLPQHESLSLQNCSSIKLSLLSPASDFFYPRPVFSFGYCRCLCLSVCVRTSVRVSKLSLSAITCDPFQPRSQNLDQICKTHWLRSLLFWG